MTTERMTPEQYEGKMKETLALLPKAFHSYVQSEAWDRGHSAGYEEVAMIASQVASDLLRAIRQYDSDMGLS